MSVPDDRIEKLNDYCKSFCGLDTEAEGILKSAAPVLLPHLTEVTEQFYTHLLQIDAAKPFLEGRVETLKATHLKWLTSLFTHNFDTEFATYIYHVGDVHVKVNLPVEFMAGAMTQIQLHLIPVVVSVYQSDQEMMTKVLMAINSVLGYNLQLMQESYQLSSLSAELEKFLRITGMSKTLFNNLARAYR